MVGAVDMRAFFFEAFDRRPTVAGIADDGAVVAKMQQVRRTDVALMGAP